MTKSANAIIAGGAEQSSHYACVVAVVDGKALGSGSRIFGFANRTLPFLGGKHFAVSAMFEAVSPFCSVVSVAFRKFVSPLLGVRAVLFWVVSGPFQGDLNRAGFASILKTVMLASIFPKRSLWFDALASWAPLHALRSAPSWVRAITRLAVGHLTLPTVTRKTIWPFLADVKGRGWFCDFTFGTKFLVHSDILGRASLDMKTLSLSTGV